MGNRSLFALDRFGAAFAVIYAALVLLDVAFQDQAWSSQVHAVGLLAGIAFVLWGSKFVLRSPWLAERLTWLAGMSFFVFAAHEPLLTIYRKLIYKALTPLTTPEKFWVYLLLPVVVVFSCLLIYRALLRVAPGFTQLITGGRVVQPEQSKAGPVAAAKASPS